tara:strand:- start:3867 stop:4703 length:837 start_codon:yes stop_codon:yes gene_type:complete
MSKGSAPSTQTMKSEPWEGQAPYLKDLYSKAQALPTQQFFPGQTYASPSDLTFQAEQLAEQTALGPQTTIASSIIPSIQEQLMSPAQRFSDPLLQESLRAGLRPMEESASRLLQQARRDATGAGQLGGTRQGILESEVIKDMLTKQSDVASKLYGDVYGDTLSAQARGLAFAPQAMSTLMQPSASLANIAAGTVLPGTQTTTAPGGQTGGLAGALGGAGLASSLGIGAGSTLAGAAPGLFGSAIGAVGPQVPGALSGLGLGAMNPYILGGALLGGLFS